MGDSHTLLARLQRVHVPVSTRRLSLSADDLILSSSSDPRCQMGQYEVPFTVIIVILSNIDCTIKNLSAS